MKVYFCNNVKVNDSQGKTYALHNSVQEGASNVFHMFAQSIKFCTFHFHVLKTTDI